MTINLSEITELKYTSLIKIVILEENFKWHLEAFASEFFTFTYIHHICKPVKKSTLFLKRFIQLCRF